MSRWFLHAAAFAALVAGTGMPAAHAQESAPYEIASPDANPLLPPNPAGPMRIAAQNGIVAPPVGAPPAGPMAGPIAGPVGGPVAMPPGAGYVKLNAPMYPCPRPNIPIWTGATMITNQALAPHEMLYPHTYRAMYPPFYHRVHGKYFWTPFGMRSHENWKLQGTMVEVKYRSSWPHWGGPHKPVISTWGGPWK